MDDIQRKLALIDQRLAGGGSLYQRIAGTSPLAFPAVGLIVGIVIQNKFELALSSWLILLTLCGLSAVLLFVIQETARLSHYALVSLSFCALVCFVCLGAIRLSSFYQPRPDDIRNLVGNERTLATIRGLIVTDPYINQNQQWQFARFTYTDPVSSFYLEVEKAKTVAGWAKTTGIVRVQVDEPVLDLKAGDYIQAYCWLDRFKKATNPGQFDIAKYLAQKNVFIAASIDSRDAIKLVQDHRKEAFTKLKSKLREIATQALLGELDIESENYALLQALVLGYRAEIDSNTYRAFQKTGLLHFICLSGMNFMILFWIIWWLCKAAGLMKRTCAVICLAAAGIFLLVVPPQPPAIRAAIMSSVFCVSFFFRRKYNPFNALSLAAVILLLIKPTDLFDASWQLSFTVVLGLLLFCGRIHFFLYEKITGLPWGKKAPKTGLLFSVIPIAGTYLLQLFSTCITAWLGGAGISLYHFHRIQYLTSIWTVVVAPLIGAISIMGYLKILIGLVMPSVAALLDIIIAPLSELLIWLVKLFASWDISGILIGEVSPAIVIFYYVFIIVSFFAYFRRKLLKKIICAASIMVIIVLLGAAKWHRTYRDNLVLTCLDVSHGQVILAQLPGKANVLFDAGSLHKSDIGKRIVAPFLDYNGINKIDAIIISHNDVDHINGIPEIVEHCDVNGVYTNEAFLTAAKAYPNDTAAFLDNVLRKKEKDFEIKNIKDLNLNSAAKIKILWPSEKVCCNNKLSDNDKSVVSLIEFAGTKILLCSDIEKFAQQELLQFFPDLKANIVFAPHHGLGKSSQIRFLESLDPDILIYSCGQSQYETMNRASDLVTHDLNKIRSFYTPKDGAITVCIKNDGTTKITTFAQSK